MNAGNPKRSRRSRQHAFTLKELLVILFTLAFLGTVAFASMSSVRDRTIIAQCESNLRQFTLAVLVYGGENSDKLPPATTGSWAWDLSWAVGNSFNAYGAPWQVMYCPGTAPRFSASDNNILYNFAPVSFHVVGYALTFGVTDLYPTNINSSISPQSIPFGPVFLPPPLPSKRVLLADATLNNAANGTGSWDSVQGGYNKTHTTAHMAGSVPAGGNVAFLDSHIEWRPFSQMTVRTGSGIVPSFFW